MGVWFVFSVVGRWGGRDETPTPSAAGREEGRGEGGGAGGGGWWGRWGGSNDPPPRTLRWGRGGEGEGGGTGRPWSLTVVSLTGGKDHPVAPGSCLYQSSFSPKQFPVEGRKRGRGGVEKE